MPDPHEPTAGATERDPLEVASPLFEEFAGLYERAYADGAASALTKELVALGTSIGRSCEPCAEYHIRRAIELGATRGALVESLFVAFLAAGSVTTPAVRRLVRLVTEHTADPVPA
ncbi:MAG TPA: carboxymuconolactone decarboxylase family protein [Pseudonocardiaceae bacterium]